jgi:hypothetical protein
MTDNTIAGFGPSEKPASSASPAPSPNAARRDDSYARDDIPGFQGIEGLILDLPSSASGPHYFFYRAPGQLQIRDPCFNQALESRVKERTQMDNGLYVQVNWD